MADAGTTPETPEEEAYPENWRFDEHGVEVRGKFVKFDVGQTGEYGDCPIVVLNVEGTERSVWLFHTALRSKFEKEVQRRDVEVGEQINIRQLGQKRSSNQRNYTDYMVSFPDAPPVDQKSIFGVSAGETVIETEAAELPESF